MARYRVRAADGAAARAAVLEFLAAVREHEPDTVYEAYCLPDDVSFLHLMRFPDGDAEERHRGAPHTARFARALHVCCDDPPVFTELRRLEPGADA